MEKLSYCSGLCNATYILLNPLQEVRLTSQEQSLKLHFGQHSSHCIMFAWKLLFALATGYPGTQQTISGPTSSKIATWTKSYTHIHYTWPQNDNATFYRTNLELLCSYITHMLLYLPAQWTHYQTKVIIIFGYPGMELTVTCKYLGRRFSSGAH